MVKDLGNTVLGLKQDNEREQIEKKGQFYFLFEQLATAVHGARDMSYRLKDLKPKFLPQHERDQDLMQFLDDAQDQYSSIMNFYEEFYKKNKKWSCLDDYLY